MAFKENNEQIKNLNNRASTLPVKERELLGIEREFNLNNVLYTFLLQKRAEAQIQKASNKPDNELIDPARVELRPVSPNKAMIYLLAVLMGLGIPFIVVLLADSFDTKITNVEDLKLLTNLPITGYIPHSKLNYQTVVLNESQSQIAEAFRTFRARMQYFTRDTQSPIILVTSSMTDEGKSFVSMNLASAYSLAGKKTVIVGFDLRKPKYSPDFPINPDKGLSNFLISQNSLEEIIQSSGFENLDIIPAGPVPPNPAELMDSDKTVWLFSELRKRYEFIIVDSAPIGTVSDCYPIAHLADASILLVRSGKSRKKALESTISDISAIGVNGLNILINDLKMSKGAYSYKYKYK
jgi:capsular exopolysaccharide synthesis family protein